MRAITSSTSRTPTVLRALPSGRSRTAAPASSITSMALSGQEAVGQVAHGEIDGGAQRRGGVVHAVVLLVARREPLQDAHRLVARRLAHVDLLEAARERAVALEVAVLLVGGRAHEAQLAGLKQRLEQVRGVDGRALGRPGAEDRVHLVDEQDRILALAQRRDQRLEARLEIAAIARAGEQRAEVEREDLGACAGPRARGPRGCAARAPRRAPSCRRRSRPRTADCSCAGARGCGRCARARRRGRSAGRACLARRARRGCVA